MATWAAKQSHEGHPPQVPCGRFYAAIFECSGVILDGIITDIHWALKMASLSFSDNRGGNHEARVRRQGLRETPEED